MGSGSDPVDPPRQLRVARTLRRALSCWWEHLGVSSALSLVFTTATMATLGVLERLGMFRPAAQPLALLSVLAVLWLIGSYFTYGGYRIACAMVFRQEVSIWLLFPRTGWQLAQAFGLAALQTAITAACMANTWFYVSLRSGIGTVLAVVFGYILALWLLICIYQWPLLVSAQTGLIPANEGHRPSLRRVFRNALVLFLTAPGYAAGFALASTVAVAAVALTGIGLILAAPALVYVLGTQALHDHMVRFGMIPPPPEGLAPLDDDWHVPQT